MASPFAIAPLERAEAEAALKAWAHSQEPLPDREIVAPPEVDDGRDRYDPAERRQQWMEDDDRSSMKEER